MKVDHFEMFKIKRRPPTYEEAKHIKEDETELPFGVQFMSANNCEETLFTYASSVEML